LGRTFCHRLEQGSNKLSGRCSLLTPHGKGKGGKGRKTYNLNIKTALLITLIIPIILTIREIKQNIQNQYGVSWSWVPQELASHQQLPGWHQEVLD